MEKYTYLIVGGGIAADAAVRGIRELDQKSKIGVISEEPFFPYERYLLAQGLWRGKEYNAIWKKTEKENVTFHLERKVTSINADLHIVTDEKGNAYWYEKLLFATGGTPKKLPDSAEGVIYFRTLHDYHKLREICKQGDEFIIVGAGFIGTDFATALTLQGKKVSMIFDEQSIGSTKYPKKFSRFLNAFFTEKGVRLIPSQTALSISKKKGKYVVETRTKERFYGDCVLVGIGIEPNIELAKGLKLETNNGIVVDRYLETSRTGIYAAGDVANFFSPHLEKRVRIEHRDSASSMGLQAGRNMAGAKEHYNYLPFYSGEHFELSYEAIGETNKDMEIIEDWQDLYRVGALYYLKEEKLKGAILWGIKNKMDEIRKMIASKQHFTKESLVGKIRN